MLEGLTKYGIERWDALADYVGTKSSYQCRAHYMLCFLDGSRCAPMPDMSRLVTLEEETAAAKEREENASKNSKMTKEMQASRLANDEIKTIDKAGYHFKRQEFEEEWDNSAEVHVG